jgi:hypothetical protein
MERATSFKSSKNRFLLATLLAGPFVWGIYFLVGYLLIEAACKTTLFGFTFLGLTGISTIILGLTLVAILIVLYAGLAARRQQQAYAGQQGLAEPADSFDHPQQMAEGHTPFMAYAAVLLNILFALLIILTGLAVFFLYPC